MKIAVVGAGIFGVTIALKLDKVHDVTLYESSRDIMTAASRTNQLRLHRGFTTQEARTLSQPCSSQLTFLLMSIKRV